MFVFFLLLVLILLSVCWFNILLLLCDNNCIMSFRLKGARNFSLERNTEKEISPRSRFARSVWPGGYMCFLKQKNYLQECISICQSYTSCIFWLMASDEYSVSECQERKKKMLHLSNLIMNWHYWLKLLTVAFLIAVRISLVAKPSIASIISNVRPKISWKM